MYAIKSISLKLLTFSVKKDLLTPFSVLASDQAPSQMIFSCECIISQTLLKLNVVAIILYAASDGQGNGCSAFIQSHIKTEFFIFAKRMNTNIEIYSMCIYNTYLYI